MRSQHVPAALVVIDRLIDTYIQVSSYELVANSGELLGRPNTDVALRL